MAKKKTIEAKDVRAPNSALKVKKAVKKESAVVEVLPDEPVIESEVEEVKKGRFRFPRLKLNFGKKELEVLDDEGTDISPPKGFIANSKEFGKTFIKYSPMGIGYYVSTTMYNKASEILDKAVNQNNLNSVENINFEDVVKLIEDGQDKFEELHLVFNASQANGFNINSVASQLAGKGIGIDIGKQGSVGLEVNVKYKKSEEKEEDK